MGYSIEKMFMTGLIRRYILYLFRKDIPRQWMTKHNSLCRGTKDIAEPYMFCKIRSWKIPFENFKITPNIAHKYTFYNSGKIYIFRDVYRF